MHPPDPALGPDDHAAGSRTPAGAHHPADERPVRGSDYADDMNASEHDAVSTGFDRATGRRMKRGALMLALVLALGFLAVSLGRWFHDRAVARETARSDAAPRPVNIVVAKASGDVQPLALPGQTAPWHSSTIYARVSGYVKTWQVDIGDRVRRGQVLATIDTPELDAQLAAAHAALVAAEARVRAGQAEAVFARSTYERWRDSPPGVVSEQEREQKHADYDSAVAHLKAAQADVLVTRARVDQYASLARFKEVSAPFDGVITEREIDIGNLVTAGSTSSTTPLYVITQNDPMRVFVDVPQSAAGEFMQGTIPVQVQTVDGSGRSFPGTVARTAGALNLQARTLRTEVDLPNPTGALVPGMYVRVSFGLKPSGGVQVPAAALVFRSSGPQVAEVDAGGRIHFRAVTIARDDGRVVELGPGVVPGARLALNVSSQLGEGEAVEVREIEAR